jgi:hypothetical protein
MIYPNPFQGEAKFIATVQQSLQAYLKVQNLMGQVIAQTNAYLQPGENEFDLKVSAAGIYMVTLATIERTASYKIMCTGVNSGLNAVQYFGNTSGRNRNPADSRLKGSQTGYTLGYSLGDVLIFKCKSGIYTTIVADSPSSSKDYPVDFAACTDPDGKNYPIVQIGDQTWMAENLAWLPAVSPFFYGSQTSDYYYVYDYLGASVTEAKSTSNFQKYGVIYNWTAAMNGAAGSILNPSEVQGACPSGWHLPDA